MLAVINPIVIHLLEEFSPVCKLELNSMVIKTVPLPKNKLRKTWMAKH
ncbi:hypothetical protein SLEP1_g10841 [Rubroshorea leprosula]|uniref:Uncharacterized protein n=1 Tax=Rubroshorea leprosula TaxID=152421 RepID=A0AAV5I9C8_9ROSI|nr:hypothetical protein SLEP1_g10841 [Rubroshorea leprosula]